jgi:UPF0271 protein
MSIDLNCDLGESEPRARTAALMRWISSANIACGGHAGNDASMRQCVRLAMRHHVHIGAHPGLPSAFGRGEARITIEQFEVLIIGQISRLHHWVTAAHTILHHVKLHGSLYHATEDDERLASCYIDIVARRWPGIKIYARAGGLVVALARARGIEAWDELFADRGYRDDGALVPRDQPGAVLTNDSQVRSRVYAAKVRGMVVAQSGRRLRLPLRTLCLHADTPGAEHLARLARLTLGNWLG